MRFRVRTLVCCLFGLLLLGIPAMANAETESGVALVQSKDVQKGTVTLEGNRTFSVTTSTKILDPSGVPMLLQDLVTAREVLPGIFEMDPEATIQFEARNAGKTRTMISIQVVGSSVE